jgi:hypothetical protein
MSAVEPQRGVRIPAQGNALGFIHAHLSPERACQTMRQSLVRLPIHTQGVTRPSLGRTVGAHRADNRIKLGRKPLQPQTPDKNGWLIGKIG